MNAATKDTLFKYLRVLAPIVILGATAAFLLIPYVLGRHPGEPSVGSAPPAQVEQPVR